MRMADRGSTAVEPVGGRRQRAEFDYGGESLQLGERHLNPFDRCMWAAHEMAARHELY